MKITTGILTISDRCFKGVAEDRSGLLLQELLEREDFKIVHYNVIPDEKDYIKNTLIDWCNQKISIILTTGGTGIGPRDITPDVTKELLNKELAGVAELMRIEGSKKTPNAVLSRAVAGIRGDTLIINLPGSPKGAVESFEAIKEIIPHALSMISGAGHDHEEDKKQ